MFTESRALIECIPFYFHNVTFDFDRIKELLIRVEICSMFLTPEKGTDTNAMVGSKK